MLLPCALFLASTLLVKQRTRSNIKIRKVRSEANLTTLSISDISKSVNKDIEALVRDLSLSAPCSLPPLTSVTLVGGGFRTISYHGAITVFLHRKVIDGNTKFYGASLGALWCVLCVLRTAPNSDQYDDLCVSIMDTMCSYIAQTHYNWASTWGELHEVVRDALSNLPASTLPLFQDRCNISITYLFPYPHNHVVNSYSSIDDLINAVVSSMWIPFFTRGPPLLGFLKNLATLHANKWSIDGGFTDNCPRPSSRSRHVTVIDYVRWREGSDILCRESNSPCQTTPINARRPLVHAPSMGTIDVCVCGAPIYSN